MAKWGEGDPRWIVEERPDATNVNNWHWTEKNADQWSKKKLQQLLTDLQIDDPKVGKVTVHEVEKCEGEARANNRKAKLIFFYEWEIVLKWKGKVNGEDEEVNGKVTIPNLSEEHTDMKDVDVDVELTSSSSNGARALKEMLRKGRGAEVIRERLQQYVEALKSEFSQGLILPAKDQVSSAPQSKTSNAEVNVAMKKLEVTSSSRPNPAAGGVKLQLETISIEERFKCTGQELYNVLTQKEMLQVFTAAPVKMEEAKVGAEFELLGGNIQGKFVGLTPFSKITQKWRLKSWPEGHFSEVEFVISQSKDDSTLKLTQKGVPAKEVESTRVGWARYYIESIKKAFGFGAGLF